MNLYRLWHTIGMCFTVNPYKRAQYIQKHNIFYHMGDKCMVMFRKIPLYPKLISFGDNVWIASQVSFVPHDVIHYMLNIRDNSKTFQEYLGCIDIKDNVFIGTNSTVLPNVTIGPNVIVAAGTVVNNNISNGVYAGVPARYICSLEEFIAKRGQYPEIVINKHGKGGLSDETVKACWARFYNHNKFAD